MEVNKDFVDFIAEYKVHIRASRDGIGADGFEDIAIGLSDMFRDVIIYEGGGDISPDKGFIRVDLLRASVDGDAIGFEGMNA